MKEVLRLIRRYVGTPHAVRPQYLGAASPVAALDLSPEERNELYNDLERVFGLDLDDDELNRQRTLGELARYVLHLRRQHRRGPTPLPPRN